ncbi:MAG: hypothetical protein CMJ49_06150 [Planctomycetaceae bacterium]|nr:hypothetical protein [Planctomycetaceae bacterium]
MDRWLRYSRLILAVSLLTVLNACAGGGGPGGRTIWHVKAVHPEGQFLDVKAIDGAGHIHDVKAIEQDGNLHVMDVKAFVRGKVLAVKILTSDEKYAPVKAIGEDGTIFDIKALTASREILDVKGVSQSGNITHIKAIGPDGSFYGVKAISRQGQLHDIKGIKVTGDAVEATIHDVSVAAHIKALPATEEDAGGGAHLAREDAGRGGEHS